MDNGGTLIIGDVEQVLYYYIIPKSRDDYLYLNAHEYINVAIHEWIEKHSVLNIIIKSSSNNKYYFNSSFICRHNMCVNRYGINSRDMVISYSSFSFKLNRS